LAILTTLVILIVLPYVFIIQLWKTSARSKLQWIIEALVASLVVLWVFQAGNWSWLSYYLRYLVLALLACALFVSWRKARALPIKASYSISQKIYMGVNILLILIFGTYNALILTSYQAEEPAIELVFPLRSGVYYVGHGGDHVLMNYHHAYEPQKYALDILKLHPLGWRAQGLLPKQLDKYAIYSDELYSPCNGTVMKAVNDLPDLIPPERYRNEPAGNHLVLWCEGTDADLYLAHLQQGSITVKPGDKVQTGQILGRIGNSGNTSEPHLHIHAEKDGKGIPLKFNGKFLVRNSLIIP
jgi:hypothetical protein